MSFDMKSVILKLALAYFAAWTFYIWLSSYGQVEHLNRINLSFEAKTFKSISKAWLVIAHPDDEVMFFSPTLFNLDRILPDEVEIGVVCLSKGVDVDGSNIGMLRANELKTSLEMMMGSGRLVDLNVLDYQDGKNEIWDIDQIVGNLSSMMINDSGLENVNGKQLVLTFDKHGVSGHPNHIACYEAVSKLNQQKDSMVVPIYLNSHHRIGVAKYTGFLSLHLQYLKRVLNLEIFSNDSNSYKNKINFFDDEEKNGSTNLSLFNAYSEYVRAYSAMLNAHRSQMVWFRYGWWSFSSFCFVNDLEIAL